MVCIGAQIVHGHDAAVALHVIDDSLAERTVVEHRGPFLGDGLQ